MDWKIWQRFSRSKPQVATDEEAGTESPQKKKGRIRENIEVILSAILIAVGIRIFLVDNYQIPTGSMVPNLLEGDRLFVTKFIYGVRIPVFSNFKLPALSSPDRGSVVIFHYPHHQSPGVLVEAVDLFTFAVFGLDDKPKNFVKRVVGLPGELIRVAADGQIFIDGRPVKRTFYQRRTIRMTPVRQGSGYQYRVEFIVNGKTIHTYTKTAGANELNEAVYTLYREQLGKEAHIVQYRNDTGSLRPFPVRISDESPLYSLVSKRNDIYGLPNGFLYTRFLFKKTPLIMELGSAVTQQLTVPDSGVVTYNRRGEVWYKLPGQTNLTPLFVDKGGELWVRVPEHHYFVMGDNRDNSSDSRDWGFVHEDYLMGTPLIRYYPFDRFGTVK